MSVVQSVKLWAPGQKGSNSLERPKMIKLIILMKYNLPHTSYGVNFIFGTFLTFLVSKKQSLLCRVWPLEGSVIIVIHATGHVGCAPLHHRHILSDGELTLATCGIIKQRLRLGLWHEATLNWFLVVLTFIYSFRRETWHDPVFIIYSEMIVSIASRWTRNSLIGVRLIRSPSFNSRWSSRAEVSFYGSNNGRF